MFMEKSNQKGDSRHHKLGIWGIAVTYPFGVPKFAQINTPGKVLLPYILILLPVSVYPDQRKGKQKRVTQIVFGECPDYLGKFLGSVLTIQSSKESWLGKLHKMVKKVLMHGLQYRFLVPKMAVQGRFGNPQNLGKLSQTGCFIEFPAPGPERRVNDILLGHIVNDCSLTTKVPSYERKGNRGKQENFK
jgi:hypothetical protein